MLYHCIKSNLKISIGAKHLERVNRILRRDLDYSGARERFARVVIEL